MPHRCVHLVRRRPGRLVPGDSRPRRRRDRRRSGQRRHQRQAGRPCDSAIHAGMPAVRILSFAEDQPVPGDSRHAGSGADARRHQPLQHRRQAAVPLHGHIDLRQLFGDAGNIGGEDSRRRALRQGLLHRLRRHHRHRGGHLYRQGSGGRERGGVRSRRHRPERDSGRAHGRRRNDHRRRHQSGAQGVWRKNSA